MDALNRPVKRQDFVGLFTGVLIGAGATAFLLKKGDDPLPLLLAFAVFYPALFLSVCLHELGHAWGALSAGGDVNCIEMGRRYARWKPWRFHFLGVRWVINSAPTCGLAHASFAEVEHYRARRCWMIACGPLMNLILLGAGLLAVRLTAPSYLALPVGWCMAQTLLFSVSIIPRVLPALDAPRANDALLFWQTLHMSDQEILQNAEMGKIGHRFAKAGTFAWSVSITELIERHESNPDDLPILWHLAYRLSEACDPRHGTYFGKLADHPKFPAKDALLALDIHLTQQLNVGPPEDRERAARLSQKLVSLSDTTSTRGTRGSVLVDIGRVAEGKALLNEVLDRTTSNFDKAYANAFLALAAKTEGNLTVAREHAATARKADPVSPVLARVADLL